MSKAALSESAVRVLEARYLRRKKDGTLYENFQQMIRRVSKHVASVEKKSLQKEWEKKFFDLQINRDFLPNSPTLMNAGTEMKLLSACFVLPVQDSMSGIFDSLKLMALIQQAGGGTGFSFSSLRKKGDEVSQNFGTAAGPVSFMRIFDAATENIRQGGRRRGANMGILRVDHPDILDFIEAKQDGKSFQNFNLSIAVTDAFMKAVSSNSEYALFDPRTKKKSGSLSALLVFEKICKAAWQTGDPGLIFIDEINRKNPTPQIAKMEATNPCGEVPLLPFEACNLGSLNLSHMVKQSGGEFSIDWEKLSTTIHTACRFLDNVIDAQSWPSDSIKQMVTGNRKIGLGVMGFSDMLVKLGVSYGDETSLKLADTLMRFIQKESFDASVSLAKEKGVFPHFKKSIYAKSKTKLRNATRTSIAPTGTISIIADTSAGIEPLFALAYERNVLDGQKLTELNPLFVEHLKQNNLDVEQIKKEVLKKGSLKDVTGVPEATKKLFKTALELSPEIHLSIQEIFQKHTDNAVSKTINLPETSTVEEIRHIYSSAWKAHLKGITIYRYGSHDKQVLTLGTTENPMDKEHFARCAPNDCKL